MSADAVAQPELELLNLLADHGHGAGCDYQAGYLTALRRATCYVQDYEHDPATAARIQAPMLRAIAIAECTECNLSGCIVADNGRHVDHHPIGGTT